MRLDLRRRRIAEHAGQEARGRLHDRQRGDLASEEHEVSQRDLLVHEIAYAFIETLVAATHQRDAGVVP